MFTQCPECGVVLELQASNLRDAQAYVRCGQCGAVFNALDTLTDEPSASADNLARPDQELAPPLLEPDRPAPASQESEPGSAYADLPGYDFDVEYVSEDDEFGEASSNPELRVGETDYFTRDGSGPSTPLEEAGQPTGVKTGAASNPAHPLDADNEDIEAPDDIWQREAMQSLAELGLDDFPEAKPVDIQQHPGFAAAQDTDPGDGQPEAQESEIQSESKLHDQPENALPAAAYSDISADADQDIEDLSPGSESPEDSPVESVPETTAPAEAGPEEDETPASAIDHANEADIDHPNLRSDETGGPEPDLVEGAAQSSEAIQTLVPDESPVQPAEPFEQPADSDDEWNEVADWLVEFTGGQTESEPSPSPEAAGDSTPDAGDQAESPLNIEPGKDDAQEMTQPPATDPETDKRTEAETEPEPGPKADLESHEPADDPPSVDAEGKPSDDIQDWVLEEEVLEVMADLEAAPQSSDTADDGSYSLTDDIPAQESPPDLDPDSIVLAPLTPQDEAEIERRPYDLSDESHLYESEDDAEWLSPKVARSVAENEPASRISTVAWVAVGAFLALLLTGQIIYALAPGAPESSLVRQWARSLCNLAGCSVPLVKDTSKIVMINRSVRPHPGVEGTLLITAIFRNEADHAQPFPIVEVTLSDLSGQRIGMRRFEPQEYLETGNDIEQGMQPMTLVPVTLEVIEPESEAPDFLFDFY